MKRLSGTGARGNMRHGLISLLTVVVIISLATAAVLTVSTAFAMRALANRQANMTTQGYDAERSAQSMLAGLDDELVQARKEGVKRQAMLSRVEQRMNNLLAKACVEGVTATYGLDDNMLTCIFTTDGGRMLTVRVALLDNATYDVDAWRLTAAPEEEDTGDMLWTGTATGE